MNVRRRGIDTELDAERPAELQLALELSFGQDVHRMARQVSGTHRANLLANRVGSLDLDRLDLVSRFEPRYLTEERKVGIGRTLDVLGLAETVACTRERSVSVRDGTPFKRIQDQPR